MAIQSSGRILFSDLANEFGDTAPHRLSEFYRDGGKVPSVNSNVPTSGRIRLFNFYGAVNELLQTVTASASINAQTIFGSDWGSAVPKRLSIPSGVIIGPLTIPSGMGGTLEVDVAGEIQGIGGSASGGAGGNAITADNSFTLNVLSGGAVRGGGGGGGLGGAGGNGTQSVYRSHGYQVQYMGWEVQGGGTLTLVYFYGQQKTIGGNVSSTNYGNQTVYRGGGSPSGYSIYWYEVTNTTGGAGGAGGVGQGYNQSSTSGSSGSAGGTNAGTGGTGGSGGGYATAGSAGSAGTNGNATNGLSGASGGAAGRAVLMNAGTVTVNNSGTINGAY